MWWLFFSFFTLLFACLGKDEVTKDPKIRSFYRCCLVFVLGYVVGLGGQDFTDHYSYIELYRAIDSTPIGSVFNLFGAKHDAEAGYRLLEKVANILGFSYVGFFLIVGILTNALIVNTCYRFRYPVIAIMVFVTSVYFSQQCNLVRQMLAGGVVLYSFRYVENSKWKYFLITNFIAISIHRSAMFAILFFPLCFAKEKHYNIIRYVLSGLWVISFAVALNIIHINYNLGIFNFLVIDDYSQYVSDLNIVGKGEGLSIDYLYQFFVMLWVVYLYRHKTIDVYITALLIGGITMNLQEQLTAMMRLSYYFAIVFVFVVPEMLSSVEKKPLKYLFTFLLYAFVIRYTLVHVNHIVTDNQELGKHMYSITDILQR